MSWTGSPSRLSPTRRSLLAVRWADPPRTAQAPGTRGLRALLLRASAALLAVSAFLLPAVPAVAAGSTDVTSRVLADANVTLSGPTVIDLPAGTTTYTGTFSGTGTLTIAGSGTLVLTRDSDFTLPASLQHQEVTTSGGNWPYPIVTDPDQPAVIVDPGATLQYGDGGSAGVIGDYPYASVSRRIVFRCRRRSDHERRRHLDADRHVRHSGRNLAPGRRHAGA
jgi:hypothetical protein